MSTLFGFDCEEVEQVELRVMDVNAFISEEELAAAIKSCPLNGFNIVRQVEHDSLYQPSFVFQKETIFEEVAVEKAHFVKWFPCACSKKMLQQLTEDCKGKGLEKERCLLGLEVYSSGKQGYKICPTLKIDI